MKHLRFITALYAFLFVYPAFSGELRTFTGSNGKAIEAEFLQFDSDTEIVKIKLKNGKEQNVKLSLFSQADQDFIKGGGSDNPFGEDSDSHKLVPGNRESEIAKTFLKALNEQHVSGKKFDRDMAKKAFEKYIDNLDPWKFYFLQSDIDEFRGKLNSFAEKVTGGDVSLGFEIYNKYMERVDEAVDIALKILESPIDFTIDEEYILDKDKLTFPKSVDELKDRWRKKIKHEILVLKSGDGKNDPTVRLKKRYAYLKKRQSQTTNDDILGPFLTAIGISFDDRTIYMAPVAVENFGTDRLEGIGATLTFEDGGILVAARLTPGGPAERSGKLNAGDRITGVGQGRNGAIDDIDGMPLGDIVKLVRGPKGSIARLEIIDKENQKKYVEIERDAIDLRGESISSQIFTFGKRKDGKPCRIGVIRIAFFSQGSADKVRNILHGFRDKDVDAVLLDFEGNGGHLHEILRITGFFIETGAVVQTKGRNEFDGKTMNDTDSSIVWKGPLVMLSNRICVSGPNFLMGAMQDYRRGLIVGDSRTSAWGCMQQFLDLGELAVGKNPNNRPKYGNVRVTISSMYRPSGKTLQGDGVRSDIVIPSLTEVNPMNKFDDNNSLRFENIPPVGQYPTFSFVSPEIIDKLTKKSQDRIKGNDDFKKLKKEIDSAVESQKRKTVSLNEKKFFAESKRSANNRSESVLEERQKGGSKIVKDFYLDEVLAITVDYVNLLP